MSTGAGSSDRPASNEGVSAGMSRLQDAISRRQAGLRMLGAAGMLVSVSVLAGAGREPLGGKDKDKKTQPLNPNNRPGAKTSQPGSQAGTQPGQPDAGASWTETITKPGRTRDWTLKVNLHLDAYQSDLNRAERPDQITITTFEFKTASVLFPVLKETGTSKCDATEVKSEFLWDGKPMEIKPAFAEDFQCGARYGRWDLRDLKGRTWDLNLDIPMRTWAVLTDEKAAAKIPWAPLEGAPPAIRTCLNDQMGVEVSAAVVQDAIKRWTGGKPLQQVPPFELARFLMGRVVEDIQPSGDGIVSAKTGLFQGFDLKGAAQTLRDGRGSPYDQACVLCAIYRAAGLPARIVIGLDLSESKGQESRGLKVRSGGASGADLHPWVEFALYDDKSRKAAWIPADVVRQRRFSSKIPPAGQPWKYFGGSDRTDDTLPISHHFHPPTTVLAHGSPAMWGWLTTPETQFATQALRFSSITTPKSGTNMTRPNGTSGR